MCALMGERERVRVPKDERGRGERESEEEEGGRVDGDLWCVFQEGYYDDMRKKAIGKKWCLLASKVIKQQRK